jgi:glycosyltransferase involved in cell wall biosynthesis
MADLTAIILTKNEEQNIKKCITSIKKIAKRIIVVDSFSEDNTIKIAKEFDAEIIQHKFETHAKQFKFAVIKANIKTKWILKLDADEWLTDESAIELEKLCNDNNDSNINGIILKFSINFMGKNIRHGGMYPWYKLSVYKYGKGDIEDRNMDEHIFIYEGQTVKAKKESLHMCFKGLDFLTKKCNWYSNKEVLDYFNSNKANTKNIKSKVKMSLYYRLPLGFRSWLYYKYRYIVRFGFLDGKIGKIYFFLNCYWYRYLVDAKILEHKKLNTELFKTEDLK